MDYYNLTRVRVGHRPARLAGHGLRRRPLRRPDRAARRQAGAGGGLRAWASSALLLLVQELGTPVPDAGAAMPTPWCPTRPRMPHGDARARSRCAPQACACRCMPPGRRPGSMKSQFKKADASGAALCADLRRRRAGARRGRASRRCATAAARRSQPLAAGRAGPLWAATLQSPASRQLDSAWQPISTSKNRNSSTSSSISGTPTATSITWVAASLRARRLRRLERLAVLAARARPRRPRALYDEVERSGAGRRHRAASSARCADMKDKLRPAPPTRSRPACWPPRLLVRQGHSRCRAARR